MTSWNFEDALRNLVSFEQFKKREKHQWKGDTFSKVAGFELHVCLSMYDLLMNTRHRQSGEVCCLINCFYVKASNKRVLQYMSDGTGTTNRTFLKKKS